MTERGPEKDVAVIKATLEAYARHLNEGNIEEWMSLWGPMAVQMMPFVPAVEGKDAIREVMKPIFEKYTVELTIKEIQDVLAYLDSGVTRCTYSMKLTDENGRRVPDVPDGKTLTLWGRNQDGAWKIHYDCSNANSRKREYP